ncbi:hypothetical protein SLE2022_372940 [Rubroshorea leprosula]
MTSTVGLELDLTWKTVSKGNRSGTRRTRKSVAKNLTGAGQVSDGNSRPAEDVTVSESEKHGVAVLGQHFNEKIEHVPIKKRRFVFHTPSPPPSPPQTPSPHVEVSDQHKDIQSASGQSSFSNSIQKQETMELDALTRSSISVIDGKFTEVSNEKVGCVEDFSGIEMLAAAACNDCVDDFAGNEKDPAVEESKQERNDSSLAPLIPLEETIASQQTDLCLPKDSGNEIKMDNSSFLPPKDSVHEVKIEDSSLLAPKNSGNEVQMKDPSHVLPKYSGIQVKMEESSLLDNAGGVFLESLSNKKTGEVPISLPDDRSLWDLNLSMDAWQRPCDNEYNDSKSNSVVNIHVDKDAMFQSTGLQDIKNDHVDATSSFDIGWDKCLPSNLGALPVQTNCLNEKENELGGCSSLGGNNNEHASSTVGHLVDSVKWVADDVSVSTQLVGLDQCCTAGTEVNNTSTVKLKEITGTSPSLGNSELGTTNHASGSEVDKIACVKSIKVEESDVASPYLPFLEIAFKDVEPRTVCQDRKTCEDFGFLDNKISGNYVERCQPLQDAIPKAKLVSRVEEIGLCYSPSKYGIMLASGLSVADDDAKGQTGGASSSFAPEIDTSALLEPEEPLMKLSVSLPATSAPYGFTVAYKDCGKEGNGLPSSSDKLNVNDPCNQSHESAATTTVCGFTVAHEARENDKNGPRSYSDRVNVNDPCDQYHESATSHDKAFNGGKESSFDLQTGYDFEDGELRESDVPCWDEIEQVDYDTEGEEERLCGLEAENNEEKLKVERGSSPGSDDIIEKTKNSDMQESLRENAVSLKMTTAAVMEASESNKNTIDFVDGSTVKDSHSALDGLMTSKRELLSGIEASPSSDALQMIRVDNCDDLNPQSEKDGGPEKFAGRDRSTPHMRGQSPKGSPFISHSAGQNSTIFHGSHPSLRSRPKSAIESCGYVISADQTLPESVDVARPENHIGRHFMSSHSNGMYRPLMRRRSLIERDDSYGVGMQMTSVRDTSPDRSRFRRYTQGVSRDIRVEYLRRIPGDSTDYFSHFPPSDAVQRSRSGNFDDSYNPSEREDGSGKFIGKDRPASHLRGRSQGGSHFFNPSVRIRHEYIRHVANDGSEYFSRLPSSDALQRNRPDNFDDSYPQAEREGGSDKFIARERPVTRMHGRSPGGGHFFNPSAGYWDSKRQHSPSRQGAYHSACPRPKSAIEGRGFVVSTDQSLPEAAAVSSRPDNRINRHFISSPSNGGYRPLVRRRSPVERDASYGMHMRMATVREGSPDRSRFRRYPQGVGRCIRDDYLGHEPDEATEYVSRLPHQLGRRERSISPEGHYAEPYKKTQSRSRSRSPMRFLVQRDRNEGSRRRSRLPDFRSDARIDRVRLFQKRFPTEYGESFISPPSGRISPQRNSRVFEDRNSGLDQFRGHKSPVRVFRESKF